MCPDDQIQWHFVRISVDLSGVMITQRLLVGLGRSSADGLEVSCLSGSWEENQTIFFSLS